MARRARNLRLDQEGRYHIRAQVAGPSGYYPLQEADNALQLVALLRHYTRLYFCSVLAFSIMGSHYHLVCRFEPFRQLSRQELLELLQQALRGLEALADRLEDKPAAFEAADRIGHRQPA
ncbi:MAG TPA: hypothetical protein P5300_05335, partial [Acidobacteriota bacterium]|nr:hypothetical protein [Acidobacteriota bacterium]